MKINFLVFSIMARVISRYHRFGHTASVYIVENCIVS